MREHEGIVSSPLRLSYFDVTVARLFTDVTVQVCSSRVTFASTRTSRKCPQPRRISSDLEEYPQDYSTRSTQMNAHVVSFPRNLSTLTKCALCLLEFLFVLECFFISLYELCFFLLAE